MVHDDFAAEEMYYHQQIEYLTAKEFGLAVKQIDNYINSQATYLKTEISADCQNIIWGLANYPQDYQDLVLKMTQRSGKQINDLGKYTECMDDTYETRYMILNFSKIPLGVNFSFCGPIQCTEDDYNALKPALVEFKINKRVELT